MADEGDEQAEFYVEEGQEDAEPVCECDEMDDSSLPLRQGDVLEWVEQSDPWRRYSIIVTADCDLAHDKHRGQLACVPVLRHDEYLSMFPLSDRLGRAREKLLERARTLIRSYQEANRPDFPVALSDEAIERWIEAVPPGTIVEELRVEGDKAIRELMELAEAIRECSSASADGGFEPQLNAVARAVHAVTQGKGSLDDRRGATARELLDTLRRLPGDAIFLHALSPRHREGYVAYLRTVVSVDEGEVALRMPDLRDGAASAIRISRLTSPYVFHLSQTLGHVFSAIGLPSRYEESRDAFIADRTSNYGGPS